MTSHIVQATDASFFPPAWKYDPIHLLSKDDMDEQVFKGPVIDFNNHSSSLMGYNTTLREAYKSAFQPDPDVIIPNKFPLAHHPLNNTHVASIPMLVNAPFGNCSADHLILNPAQFASLWHMIGNVGNVHTLAYLIPTDLPPPSSNQDLAKVVLPTQPLSNDARRITSPIPFALYQHNDYVSVPAPFIPGYYAYYDNYVKNSQVLFLSSPVLLLLPPPRPTPALASLGNSDSGDLDRARILKQEARNKDEDERELTHKDVAIKVKEALGTWVYACQATNTTNWPTGDLKPAITKEDMKSSPDIIRK